MKTHEKKNDTYTFDELVIGERSEMSVHISNIDYGSGSGRRTGIKSAECIVDSRHQWSTKLIKHTAQL